MARAPWPGPGTMRFSASRVMATANTPSLNASRRPRSTPRSVAEALAGAAPAELALLLPGAGGSIRWVVLEVPDMSVRRIACLIALLACMVFALPAQRAYAASSKGGGTGVGNVPQGTQSDASFAASFAAAGVTHVGASRGQVSCHRADARYFPV